MKRRLYPKASKAVFNGPDLTYIGRGWRLSSAGLASSQRDLVNLMEELGLYPPSIPAVPPVIQ